MICQVSQNVHQSTGSRDALAKVVYSRLFDWLVRRINHALATAGASTGRYAAVKASGEEILTIGVLDMYVIDDDVVIVDVAVVDDDALVDAAVVDDDDMLLLMMCCCC